MMMMKYEVREQFVNTKPVRKMIVRALMAMMIFILVFIFLFLFVFRFVFVYLQCVHLSLGSEAGKGNK